MRIRRNPWLPYMLAAVIPVFAATMARAQGTTPTATGDNSATGSLTAKAAVFKLEPGDQLIYSTHGNLAMSSGDKTQNEDMDIETSLTVLEKSGDLLTIYASLTASEKTTSGVNQVPGPRFTFQAPLSGSEGMDEFEKAGLAGASFPTFSVETLFAAPLKEGKSTVTVALPVSNAVADGQAVTTLEGGNVKSVSLINKGTTPVMKRTRVFSTAKNLNESIETSVTLSLTAQNMPIEFAIQDTTKLKSVVKLSPDQLKTLKEDVESAIPVATKLRSGRMSSPEVMKSLLTDMKSYLKKYPEGQFAFIFNTIVDQLDSMVKRTANSEKIKVGAVAPDFTAKTIDNKTIKLSDYKGKVVLLDFWATWCGPCMMELPNVIKMYEANKDKKFEIIGISADQDLKELQRVVEEKGIAWPQIFDDAESGAIQELYGVMKYPTTILLDADGKISAVDLRGDALDEAVTKLLDSSK